jgi:hypothetical protein
LSSLRVSFPCAPQSSLHLNQRFIFLEDHLCASAMASPVSRLAESLAAYATLNIQGSCNNLCDVFPDPAEFAAADIDLSLCSRRLLFSVSAIIVFLCSFLANAPSHADCY